MAKKVLKIRFVKFDKMLVAETLECGVNVLRYEYKKISVAVLPCFFTEIDDHMTWFGMAGRKSSKEIFHNNSQRDEYTANLIAAITEAFNAKYGSKGELKVGEMCEVSDEKDFEGSGKLRLIAILPESIAVDNYRYFTERNLTPDNWDMWKYARPVAKRIEPSVEVRSEGDEVYTWEMEAGNDRKAEETNASLRQ